MNKLERYKNNKDFQADVTSRLEEGVDYFTALETTLEEWEAFREELNASYEEAGFMGIV